MTKESFDLSFVLQAKNFFSTLSAFSLKLIASSPYNVGIAFIAIAIYLY